MAMPRNSPCSSAPPNSGVVLAVMTSLFCLCCLASVSRDQSVALEQKWKLAKSDVGREDAELRRLCASVNASAQQIASYDKSLILIPEDPAAQLDAIAMAMARMVLKKRRMHVERRDERADKVRE
ncbi:hypothetical protein TSMEX_004023 [Taenia solium]|eukprot:TsM_000153200 transcript=TsM_000153200 gene=TsM_000153200